VEVSIVNRKKGSYDGSRTLWLSRGGTKIWGFRLLGTVGLEPSTFCMASEQPPTKLEASDLTIGGEFLGG
jgi:hypothetical protein